MNGSNPARAGVGREGQEAEGMQGPADDGPGGVQNKPRHTITAGGGVWLQRGLCPTPPHPTPPPMMVFHARPHTRAACRGEGVREGVDCPPRHTTVTCGFVDWFP